MGYHHNWDRGRKQKQNNNIKWGVNKGSVNGGEANHFPIDFLCLRVFSTFVEFCWFIVIIVAIIIVIINLWLFMMIIIITIIIIIVTTSVVFCFWSS